MTIDILVGGTYRTNKHGLVTVLEIENSKKVLVKFHNTRFEKFVTSGNLRKGSVLDDSLAYYGSGAIMDIQGKVNNKRSKEYSLWQGMLNRCYSEAVHERIPHYKDCEVSNFFKLFSNFVKWCHTQVGFNVEGFDLDKDLLIKNNKLYSENTCVFLPKEINISLEKCNRLRGDFPIGVSFSADRSKFLASIKVNGKSKNLGRYDTPEEAFQVYKGEKEHYLKVLADKWKDHIDPRAYNALMSYEVSIDD